ncbi:MAG: hypothetical protein AAB600_04195, partial [Patescibacteria group bacterium]
MACTTKAASPEPECVFPAKSGDNSNSSAMQSTTSLSERYSSLVTTEESVERDWQQFHSLNYPYQIDYPEGWKAMSAIRDGKRQDIFRIDGDNWKIEANISCEPVGEWVRAQDYAQHVLNNLTLEGNTEGSVDPNQIDIDGKKAFILLGKGNGKNQLGMYLPWIDVDYRMVTFLEGGHAWTIKFASYDIDLRGDVDAGAR